MYDIFSTRSLSIYLVDAILVLLLIRKLRCKILCSMLLLLTHFIIGDSSSSLRDLVRELNVIKGRRGTTFGDKAYLVLMVTTD